MAYKEYILHNGRVREVHGRFSHQILYKDNGVIKGVIPHEARYCDAMGNLFPDETQATMRGEQVEKEIPLIQEPVNQGMTVKVGNPNPNPAFESKPYVVPKEMKGGNNPLGENGSQHDDEVHNLNAINTDAEIRKVARAVSGLGYKTLVTIIRNRPASGYESLDHLREVNGSSIPKNLKWDTMESFLSF